MIKLAFYKTPCMPRLSMRNYEYPKKNEYSVFHLYRFRFFTLILKFHSNYDFVFGRFKEKCWFCECLSSFFPTRLAKKQFLCYDLLHEYWSKLSDQIFLCWKESKTMQLVSLFVQRGVSTKEVLFKLKCAPGRKTIQRHKKHLTPVRPDFDKATKQKQVIKRQWGKKEEEAWIRDRFNLYHKIAFKKMSEKTRFSIVLAILHILITMLVWTKVKSVWIIHENQKKYQLNILLNQL